MRIAFVGMIRDPWGGSEELWAATATEALKQGHQVFFSGFKTAFVHPKLQQLIQFGLQTDFRLGYIAPTSNKVKYLFERTKIFASRRIRNPYQPVYNFQPDVVVYIGTAFSILDQPQLIRKFLTEKIPFIHQAQLANSFQPKFAEKQTNILKAVYKKAAEVHFVSEGNRKAAEKILDIHLTNARVVRNPVNMKDVSEINYPENDIAQFALVGNLIVKHKGQDLLLRSLATEKWKHRNFIVNIYGTGPDESALKTLSKSLRLEQKVFFHGSTNNIREVWESNQVLLMPSLMEGMPLAVVEAMLCGRTVLATDIGGHREWLDDSNGFIAPEVSVQSISETLEEAWAKRHQWKEMGIKAREKALTLYDPSPGKTYLQLLLQLNRTN